MATGLRIHRFVASVFSVGRASASTRTLTVGQIHDEHADFVWRSLQRLGVRESDLEDAMQEVFIVVHRKLDTFDGSSRISTWLYGICLRVASASRNRAHVRRERPTPEIEDSIDERENPEAALATLEERQRLLDVLETLAPEKRAVFVMFEIEGVPAVEIAEMHGVPVGTEHSRLSAARTDFAEGVKRLEIRERFRGER
jgi:RNA polymerase sigma-70 factor (ECF subfamily)